MGGITSIKDFWTPTCFLWNLKQKPVSYCCNISHQGLILKTLEKIVKNWETHSWLRAAPKACWNITEVSVRMNVILPLNFTSSCGASKLPISCVSPERTSEEHALHLQWSSKQNQVLWMYADILEIFCLNKLLCRDMRVCQDISQKDLSFCLIICFP